MPPQVVVQLTADWTRA